MHETFHLHHHVERSILAGFIAFWPDSIHSFIQKKVSSQRYEYLIFQMRCIDHTLNPLDNESSVLQIQIHSFVELVKGYKMHYFDLTFQWGKMSKRAVWLGKHLKTWKIFYVKCALFFEIPAYISEISLHRFEKFSTERVLAALSTGILQISKFRVV